MKSSSLTKNKILSFNYNMNQYSNSLIKKKELTSSNKQSIDFTKKAPNTFRQISNVNTSQITKSTKISPSKNYTNFANDKGKVLVQNYITPSTNAGSNPKLTAKEIREFQIENSLNELDFLKNKILKKKVNKKINYLNLSNPLVDKKTLGKSLDITAKSINNAKDFINQKKSISTYEADYSFRDSINEKSKIPDNSKNISPRFDKLIKNYNLNKKSSEIKKNLYSSTKQNPESVIKFNNNNNFKKKNTLNVKETITKKINFINGKNKSTSANSRISSLEKNRMNVTSNRLMNSDAKPNIKNSKTSSMVNLLDNFQINKEPHLAKNTTKGNLTENKNTSYLVTVNKKTQLPRESIVSKSNSIIIEDCDSHRKKNSITGNSKISSNNNSLLKSNLINNNNNLQNILNTFKRHISSANSPKNRPFNLNKEFNIQQKKTKVNTNNVSLNTSLNKEPLTSNSNNKASLNSGAKFSSGNKLGVNFKLDLNKIKKKDHSGDQSIENILNSSNCSVKSSLRESNYYKKEGEKLSSYIKNYYNKHKEYPSTNIKFYKYGRLLGRGAFGKVNLGLQIFSGRLVAIKSFNKKSFSENSKKKIYYEFNLMKNLKNTNSIVKVYEIFETNKYIIIIMEYVCGGDLLSFIRKRSKLNEQTAKFIFRQLIEALLFINSQNIVHRDIKLDNILIDINNTIKICDFGVSKIVKKNEILHDQCGTPAYIAPEIIKNHGYEGFGVDIWSAGVVLYAMLSGTVPFKANNMDELHKIIIRGNFPKIKDISEDASDLLNGLLEIDPKKRLTPDQILRHPFLQNSKNKMVLFTNAEIVLLSKVSIDYRNAGKEDLNENFSLRNLDTQKESENNVKTKSIILAPFSSSIQKQESFLERDVKIENDVLRFVGKAIELNRNYELNNNGEIDNGVLINNSKNGENNNQSQSNILSNSNSYNKKYSKPTTPLEFNENFSKRKLSNLPSPREDSNHQHITNTFSLNEEIINIVEELGFKKDYIIRSLMNNDLNYATTTYYLLVNSSK